MPNITIQVTRKDIDNGVRGDSCRCPVARATRRALSTNKVLGIKPRIEAEYDNIIFSNMKRTRTLVVENTKKVLQFMRRFDQEGYIYNKFTYANPRNKLKPFNFTLKITPEMLEEFNTEEPYSGITL